LERLLDGGVRRHRAEGVECERGLLIKNVTSTPEISFVQEFIESREALVASGTLTRFHEAEISESSVIFGNVAHGFTL